MNSDIRLSVGFWQHPKTKKLVKRLGLEGVRSLQVLWLWAAQNKADGLLTSMDWEDIELAADWQGEERKFFDHCLGVWIEEVDGGYALHDWGEHNPWQAEAAVRSEQARQNAKSGWEKRRAKQTHANGNAPVKMAQSDSTAEGMRPQCNGIAAAKQTHANGNAPFLSLPNQEETKESSLRSDSFCAELSGDTSTRNEVPENPLPLICLPLNNGKQHAVMPEDVEHWRDLYPAVDVQQELRNMLGWLEANPRKRKTANGVKGFITRWLADKQNKGGSPRASPPAYQPGEKQNQGDMAARKTWENYQSLRARGIVA